MWKINETSIILKVGDITDSNTDAIVNAANTKLILGAGVAGAIRKKGGSSIQEECDRIGEIELGQAAITKAGELNARYVIHAASMHLGGKTTEQSLEEAVYNSLKIGKEKKLETITFPAIGTGIAGFPLKRCAEIMLSSFKRFLLSESHKYTSITVILFQEKDYVVFKDIFSQSLSKTKKLSKFLF